MSLALPSCSVIVPTHRRPAQLEACLESLAALDYPADRLQVIVVDDGGRAPLDELAARWSERIDATFLSQDRRGPAAARNAGAARARGELLAFTDDDCRPTPGWLRRLAEEHVLLPEVALGGHTRNALTANPFAATSQMIIDAGYDWHNGDRHDARFFTSNNLAVPAEAFRELGGFDETFTTAEDRDFCDRWRASGRRLRYLPEAMVDHAHDLTLAGFCRQHYRYGRGAHRFHRAFAMRNRRRIRIEPSFYLGVHRRGWRTAGARRRLAIQGALLVWHVANALGFAREWRRPGRSSK